MGKALGKTVTRGIVATFLTGLLTLLPIIITIALMAWVGSYVSAFLGPDSAVGKALRAVGLAFVTNNIVASVLGWVVVIVAIWVFGLLVRITARSRIESCVNSLINRIPVVGGIYKSVTQVVGMLKKDDKSQMKGMPVVYCRLGKTPATGFLGLLASDRIFRFGEEDCHLVYIPTSPVPMSGGLLFAPVACVAKVEMSVDEMMKIYFSLGVLSSQVISEKYASAPAS